MKNSLLFSTISLSKKKKTFPTDFFSTIPIS